MSRLDCLDGTQKLLIERISARYKDRVEMAELCGVHPRTFSDWKREKYRMSYEALVRLYEKANIPIPDQLPIVPNFGHLKKIAQLGGQRRHQLYGPLGTVESRRRGGLASIEKFRQQIAIGQVSRFQWRKQIRRPEKTELLAEFIGIMLGDGHLSEKYQAMVYFNSETDAEYGIYVENLFQSLFDLKTARTQRVGMKCGVVVASSQELIECLQSLGLRKGNKVANQVGIPDWIMEKPEYRQACLRGLIDTDGSIYEYEHRVFGKVYRHRALHFSNRSKPLLEGVSQILKALDFHPCSQRFSVCLNRQKEIDRYFQQIGTNNSKHSYRFTFSKQRRDAGVDERDRLESD